MYQSFKPGSLELAIAIAVHRHNGQVDKAGMPYILHSLRVMSKLSSSDEMIVGVLHDAKEDAGLTNQELISFGFANKIIEAIDAVTRREGEDYFVFCLRAAQNPIGCEVKLADLNDNKDLSRIATPTTKDYQRVEKYNKAIVLIENSKKHRLTPRI